jgi:uncharacterized protein YjeT (DUF2065 family)
MAPPRRLRLPVAIGAVLLLAGLALFFGPGRGRRLISAALAPPAAHGELRVSCRPEEAEVYVDGALRGTTPLTLDVPVGKHSVRIGSPRLERWRAAEVLVKEGTDYRLDVDLSE